MRKYLISIVFLLYCIDAHPQAKRIFIRVYTQAGDAILKGKLIALTDSSLFIKQDTAKLEIPVSTIAYIKTKRAFGHSVLVGALIGVGTGGILGALSSDQDSKEIVFFDYSPAEGALIGALGVGAEGALIGTIVSAFRNSKTIVLNGDISEWKKKKFLLEESDSKK